MTDAKRERRKEEGANAACKMEEFPYFCAEVGGGRRVEEATFSITRLDDFLAMTLAYGMAAGRLGAAHGDGAEAETASTLDVSSCNELPRKHTDMDRFAHDPISKILKCFPSGAWLRNGHFCDSEIVPR